VAVGGLIIIAAVCIIAFFRTVFLTRDLMDSVQALGDDRNIMQFKLFTRFLFNSIPVGIIGLFWVVICVIIMFTPAFYPVPGPLFDWTNLPWSTTEMASMAGEITLCIASIVLGFTYIPHSFKSWKLIDDYFVMLHDPWARDIGLLGTKKILEGHKMAFGTIFMVFGAIGYQGAAFYFFIPSIAVCALVAGVKYIQGLYRVGTGFNRIPTGQFQSQQAVARPPATSTQQASPSGAPQPAYFRYQPSQALYNPRAPAQSTPSLDPLASTTGIQHQILQRNQAFLQMLDDDVPGQQRGGQQQSQRQTSSQQNATAPVGSIPSPVQGFVTPAATSDVMTVGSPGKCKYCFAELPPGGTGKCPGCGAALLSL
jgi:hypothetical protein